MVASVERSSGTDRAHGDDGTFCVVIGNQVVMEMSDPVRAMLIAGGKGEEVAKYANGFYIRAAGGGMLGPLPTSEMAVDIATVAAIIEGAAIDAAIIEEPKTDAS